jgi:hypothetical protein
MSFSAKDEQTRLRILLDHYAQQFPADTKTHMLIRQQGLLLGMLAQAAHNDWTVSRDITARLEALGLDKMCRPIKKR